MHRQMVFVLAFTSAVAMAADGFQDSKEFDDPSTTGLRVSLLFDTSDSTKDLHQALPAIGVQLVEGLAARDIVEIRTFGAKVETVRSFASDRTELVNALLRMRPSRGTSSLRNALFIALKVASIPDEQGRGDAIVVVTDGRDTSSLVTPDQLRLEAARNPEVRIYALLLPSERPDRGGTRRFLSSLAESTGGKAFQPRNLDELEESCARILADWKAR